MAKKESKEKPLFKLIGGKVTAISSFEDIITRKILK
jgi:hypothetical protein